MLVASSITARGRPLSPNPHAIDGEENKINLYTSAELHTVEEAKNGSVGESVRRLIQQGLDSSNKESLTK